MHQILFYLRIPFHFFSFLRDFFSYRKSPEILLVIANPASIGGTELQLRLIAESLQQQRRGALVLLLGHIQEGKANRFLNHLRKLHIPSVRIGNLGLLSSKKWAKRVAVLFHPLAKRAKIAHFFNPAATLFAPTLKEWNLRLYYTETGMPIEDPWWRPLFKTLPLFSHLISVSQKGLFQLEKFFSYQGPSSVLPSIIETVQNSLFAREPLEERFDVVYAGRMVAGKGIEILLSSFRTLLEHFPYARLLLIGSGNRFSFFQSQVEALQISSSVQFTGWLNTDSLFSQLAQADLFCLPSESEGLPSSLLEAMSIGLPVLATDVGGIPEIIIHSISGILIPPKNQEALTSALIDFAKNPSFRRRLGRSGFSLWKKRAKRETLIAKLIDIYGIS